MSSGAPVNLPHPARPSAGSDAGAPKIVVGIDGSETSWSAFWWACGEARRLNGHVIAVYVTCARAKSLGTGAAIVGFDAGAYAMAVDRTNEEQAATLKAEAARRAAELEVEISFVHVRGDAAERLKAVARDVRADVIAVGRSTRLCHRLAGSLGRRLTRDRHAPIVVIVP